MSSWPEAHQANAISKSSRKCKEDIDGWVEPFCQPFIGTLGMMKSFELLMNDGENVAGSVAILKLGGQWVCKKVAPRAFFVCLQGIVEN